MSQTSNIIFIFFLSFVIFIFFKIKKEKFENITKIFFAAGIFFTLIGCIVVYFFYDQQALMSSILLRSNKFTERIFNIGYSLILSSFLFLIDNFIKSIKRKG